MSRKRLKFSGKITPLFPSMLTHVAEGEDSRDSLEGTNGNEGDQVQTSHDSPLLGGHTFDKAEGALNLQELSVLCTNLSNRVLALESIKDAQAAEISALKSRIKKLEKKCKPSISHHRAWLKSVKRLSMKKRFRKQEFVSKQGRKKSKPESTLDDSTIFDDQDHGMEYMETEEAVDEGRKSGETKEVQLTDDTEVVEDTGSGEKGGNAEELVSTARPDIDAARQEDSAVEPRTPPTITNIEDSSRPERSILTLKPLPTIDPKDKGKSILEEPEPAKKITRSDFDVAQIARDAEISRQLQVDLESKFLAEIIVAQRKFRDAQRAAEIRSRPPTKYQLRNLMMTYLRNMSGYKHSQLKAKSFEEIKGMYERQKKSVQDFVPIGSAKDERMIEKMNKKAAGVDEEEVLEEPDSTKVEVKQEERKESTKKRSGRRLKMKATKKSKRQKTDSDLEEEEQLKAFLNIVPDEEGEVNYEVLDKRVFRADGSSRWIKTFSEMVTRFDRMDLEELYNLVMKRFKTTTLEGIYLILWGSLKTMFEANVDDDLWKSQEEWVLKSWNFYDNYGVHILVLEDGTDFYMLAERRYPLTKETLERMLDLKVIAESESEAIFDLLRFI
ncbi:hypothetical protein Tco_1241598 [Tanacetum coccineum]